jgi:general secretion pathway protein A
VSLKYVLNPLDERETKELIVFRLRQAGFSDREPLFSEEAIREIYYATQGYPRRIALLCHDALERLVMDRQPVVTAELIKRLVGKERQLHTAHLSVGPSTVQAGVPV